MGTGRLQIAERPADERTKTLAQSFPPPVQDRLREFAYLALEAGDRRWRSCAADEAPNLTARPGKGSDAPRLTPAPVLMLRLRAGFGVSAKADVLTYLLGIGGNLATVQSMAEATGYTEATARGAASDMALADLIREAEGRPVSITSRTRSRGRSFLSYMVSAPCPAARAPVRKLPPGGTGRRCLLFWPK